MILNTLKRLLCKHNWELSRWHWFHGYNGNDPRTIEAEYICSKCTSKKYIHIEKDMDKFAEQNKKYMWQ